MQTINVNMDVQIIDIQVVGDFNIRTRNNQLYSQTIKLYHNVNNPIRFLLKNQDQKPVAVNGFEIIVDLVDASDEHIVESYVATVINQTKGICQIIVSPATLSNIENRYFYFTVAKRITDVSDDQATYIDDNYSVRLPVEVLTGYVRVLDQELDLGEVSDPNEIPLADLGTV